MLTVKELASRLGIRPRTVYRLVASGKLPQPIRLTQRTLRWDWALVREWIKPPGSPCS
jgi:excisionase family DNA binding protein